MRGIGGAMRFTRLISIFISRSLRIVRSILISMGRSRSTTRSALGIPFVGIVRATQIPTTPTNTLARETTPNIGPLQFISAVLEVPSGTVTDALLRMSQRRQRVSIVLCQHLPADHQWTDLRLDSLNHKMASSCA